LISSFICAYHGARLLFANRLRPGPTGAGGHCRFRPNCLHSM
jgi:hypothetical protein